MSNRSYYLTSDKPNCQLTSNFINLSKASRKCRLGSSSKSIDYKAIIDVTENSLVI